MTMRLLCIYSTRINCLVNIQIFEGDACKLCNVIMSHSLLWRHIVLLTVGVYSSNHRVLYTIGISMTRRFQKSVGPSVRLSVSNANKKAYSYFVIDSRKIIRISGKRVWHPLQKMRRYFQKNFQKF